MLSSNAEDANTTQQQRTLIWEVCGQRATLRQRSEQSNVLGTGTAVWDAAKVLGKYLELRARSLRLEGKRVLDLGAGCGLLSVTAAALGSTVVATDLEQLLPLLEQNIAANSHMFSGTCEVLPFECAFPLTDGVEVLTRGRGGPHDHLGAPFDVVIGSDVVFKESLVEPLLRSIRAVVTERASVLIALEIRCEELCRSFQRDASVEFLVQRIPTKRLDPACRTPYVAVFRMTPRKQPRDGQ